VQRTVVALAAGAVVGVVTVPVWIQAASAMAQEQAAALAIFDLALVTLTALQRPRLAIGGGMMLGVGLVFVYVFLQQASACTSARGCTLGDNRLQVAMAVSFLIVGLVLATIALRRPAAHQQRS
jgi:hypothetical protein